MAARVGINGFGRIGRQVLKAVLEYHPSTVDVAVVNDLADAATNAHLFRYDSNYGRYSGKVVATEKSIAIDGKEVKVTAERELGKIPWKEFGVEIVVESTGRFTDAAMARTHLGGGVKKVVITAPAKGEDITIVLGVNEDAYNPARHNIVSNASCTTNAVAPMVKVLHDRFGITRALMSTIHAYTNDQRILDTVHSDLRRARAAALNIIPTTTGAAKAVTLVMPDLAGKIHGVAFRVPTPTVSLVDLVADLDKAVTAKEVNEAFMTAAKGPLQGILEFCDEPLVSMDFKGNPASAIIDGMSTMVIGGSMVKVLSWYDNEWAYSCRVGDVIDFIARRGL